jgi:hypothetical protein
VLLEWQLRPSQGGAAPRHETVELQKEALRKLAGIEDSKLTFTNPSKVHVVCEAGQTHLTSSPCDVAARQAENRVGTML